VKTVTVSKERVDAAEIEWHVADDRRRHTRRGYIAIVVVTVLGAIAAMIAAKGNILFDAFKGGVFAFIASGITAAFINSEHSVYYRRESSLRMDENDIV